MNYFLIFGIPFFSFLSVISKLRIDLNRSNLSVNVQMEINQYFK